MLIGIAALVLAVGAYIYRQNLTPQEILTRLSASLGIWGSTAAQKAITDGSENKKSIKLDKTKTSTNAAAEPGYKSSLPSRIKKQEVLVTQDEEEEEDPTTPTAPVKIELSIPEEHEVEVRKGKARVSRDEDDLSVPMFPALNSAQRASQPAPSLVLPGNMGPPPLPVPRTGGPGLMLPPPVPNRRPGSNAAANARSAQYSRPGPSLGVPQSGPSLNVPQQRSSLQLPPTHTQPPPKPRQKVILDPGHSPLDWANHQKSLPFVPLRRITPSELSTHGARKNESKRYWTVLEGRVYDMTEYMPYHPGGEKELMRVAGKDGTKLFHATHGWVNWDNMLRGCEVGILVSENDRKEEADLEGMD